MNSAVTTRPATEDDEAFLFHLFKTLRSSEFRYPVMDPRQLESILDIQYRAQRHTYRMQYPGGDRIILFDGEPIGRIWLYRSPSQHQLVEIAVLPGYRNWGVGAVMVKEAIADARAAGVPLISSVAAANTGSIQFHQRLGFQVVGNDEIYCDLAVKP